SAAREGGALSIIRQYVSCNAQNGTEYILLCPKRPDSLPNNFTWKKVDTKGVGTILFALFFSWYYVFIYRADKIVSFSNINLFFSRIEKVTYFHNFLILSSMNLRFLLIRASLKFFGHVKQ